MASCSSSSSPSMKHQVFLSFRGEDTRLNFTSHLLKALKDTGMSVFFDEEKLERGEHISPALSQAIEASRLSVIVLSVDYASSKSCLAELSDIVDRKSSHGQIVVPIFYHVDPSHVQNIGGSFKKSFEEHVSERPIHEVKRWKAAFVEVGKLKGWHIEGGEFDRPETEHIKDIVDYVIQKLMKHQVFLSFRDEDTGLNFASHLLKALEDTGINVSSNKGKQISQAVAVPNLCIIVLSVNYASSKPCLAELSEIMDRKDNQGKIVLPIFYHVDPSHVRNLGGSFKASFDDHESKGLHQVQQWKMAFAKVGKLKGWHIEGGKSDRSDTEYIKDVVEYVIKKLNSKSRSTSEELIGMDDQKNMILGLIEKEESRVIGLYGMGGIGKTTLAEAVYNEISPKFQSRYFLLNVREKIEKEGLESVRNKLLSELLDDKINIVTPSIASNFILERLNNKRVIVVLDDVDDSDQITEMGVKHFGEGSKIIVTSRDEQVLKNGRVDERYKVKKLNVKDSLQLFSTFAFEQLNSAADFLELSDKFVHYADGSPLALKILGRKLYEKPKGVWESEVLNLKQFVNPKISHILTSSFDGLDQLEKNIFLDIACFFKGEPKEKVEEYLSSMYKGAVSGISSLLDKSLIDIIHDYYISMHDMLEEMGKTIVSQESSDPGRRSRLWIPTDIYQVLRYNTGTELIEGIKLDISKIDNIQLYPTAFENMFNLRYICFNARIYVWGSLNEKLHANGVDIVYLSNELRYLWWEYYPFKSLSSSFNPRNLVVLKLYNGNVEQLWNEDKYQDLRNLREIDVSFCKNLRKIPNLLGAVNLKRINCIGCTSLVELPCLNDLASLESLQLFGCVNLRKIPDLFGAINLKIFNCGGCTSLVELPCLCHSTFLKDISLQDCPKLKKFRHMSSNIPKLESVRRLGVPNCKALESLPELPPYMLFLEAEGCASLERVEFTDHNLNQFDSLDDDANKQVFLSFFDCFGLSQDSIKNIQTNAMLQIRYLAQRLIRAGRYQRKSNLDSIFYCFPGNEISTNEFEHLSQNSSLNLKIALNGRSGSRFLAFAICLVPDLTQCPILSGLEFNCKYQLTAASGEEFRSEFMFLYRHGNDLHYTIDHVFIPFGEDMIVKDNDYEAASFDFNIHMRHGREKFEVNVKKCGVHVFYVDAESFVVSAATEIINFSYIGGEKGKGGAKRWKYFDFL